MAERTANEVAKIFSAAGDSVTVINTAKRGEESDAEYKDKIKRNVDHLEIIKAYKKEDRTTSIWGSEDFTAINAAIDAGKAKY
jgi:pyruvate/2-oxoglutarate dehydrogenase complex dihydrolipoamide dehydrogenase (E3) component